MTPVQLWCAVTVVVLGYVIGAYYQHRDLDKLESNLNCRIDDLRSEMSARLTAIDRRFEDLKDWLRSGSSAWKTALSVSNTPW